MVKIPTDWSFTIVTVPFPFTGRNGTRQRNAIKSWMLLMPRPEIIVMGVEAGVREIAEEYGLRHIGNIGRNQCGDLDCADILQKAQDAATYNDIVYMDCDVILMPNFPAALHYAAVHYPQYTLISGRWEMSTPRVELSFSPGWEKHVTAKIFRHIEYGTDFHAFPKGLYDKLPDFSIGAGAWDGWMIWYAAQRGAAVVRMDDCKAAIHMWHWPRILVRRGKRRNERLAGTHKLWVPDATIKLTPELLR